MSVKNPNIMGIIHNSILLVDACCAEAAGMVVIFCMTYIETPTRIGNTRNIGLFCAVFARFSPKNWPFSGTDWWASGSHV